MSLKLKFFILFTGAILVPVLVFVISFGFDIDLATLKVYRSMISARIEWRREFRSHTVDKEHLADIFQDAPSVGEIRVFDGNGDLLYWRRSLDHFSLENRLHFMETIPLHFTGGGNGVLVTTSPPSPLSRKEDRWYVPLSGLLFFAIMVIVITQSMNRSIANLEKATRHIVDGDLDFELPIKGNDKLALLTRSFDSMRKHLKEEYARRSRFIMGISHDLKTPLSAISGYADAIRDGYADTADKLAKYTGIIEDKTKLLESRISLLIDYVKRETSEWKLNLKPVPLKPFFLELSRVFESEVMLTGRTFQTDIQIPEGLTVPMDEDMVLRAMENLLHNARRYSPETSTIQFACVLRGNSVFVSLANGGPGINPEDLPFIFDPFVRGAHDRKGPGLGLGLSTVESVITSHGWRIEATSEPNVATVFAVTIPVDSG